MARGLKQKVVSGILWSLLERFTVQFAGFLVTLVLARILTPDDYGTVALLTLLISMSSSIIDCGLGQALVQKKNATAVDFNSVFYANVLVSSTIYAILFFAAPSVADFYGRPILIPLLRVLALTLVIGALGAGQGAYMQREMKFYLSFRISLSRFVATSLIGVSMALAGLGPWALVGSTLAGTSASVAASWLFIGWRPGCSFSFRALRGLISFGWKFSASWFLSVLYDNASGMIIGKVYSPSDLAFVDKANQIPQLSLMSINGPIQRVTFPAMASIQDDRKRVLDVMRRMIQCSTFLVFPIMVGIGVCADNLVPLFYGHQWDASVPFVWIACFNFLLYPFHTINLQVISALGRTDIFLYLEIVKKIVAGTILLLTYRLGVVWMLLIAAVVGGPIGVFINAYPNRRLLGYSATMQVRDVIPAFLLSCVMGGAVWPIGLLSLPSWVALLIQVVWGALVYFVLACLFRLAPMKEYCLVIDNIVGQRVPCQLRPLYGAFKKVVL